MKKVARQLGRYHLLDRVSHGGMAEVLRALTFDGEAWPTLVAVKLVLPEHARDPDFIRMLVDEAKTVSRLHHENIVEIYELGVFEKIYYVAMEYVWGKDLRAVLERCRARSVRLPYELSAFLMSEALAGLDAAHRLVDHRGNPAGLVHRDFSPSNILISYSGHIKICDFGIAKSAFSSSHTEVGVIKGKIRYMSPEQAFGSPLDHRSDLFSAGSVLYETLTNAPAFQVREEADLLLAVRGARFAPPREAPESLARLVLRSMKRDRGARFQSSAEFRQGLNAFLRRRGVGDWKTELGRLMRTLFAKELDEERRALDDYRLDPGSTDADLGENLIAEALGDDAAFTKFNPLPSKETALPEYSALHEASTSLLERADIPLLSAEGAAPQERRLALDEPSTISIDILEEVDEEEVTELWSGEPEDQRTEVSPTPDMAEASPTAPVRFGGELDDSELSTIPRPPRPLPLAEVDGEPTLAVTQGGVGRAEDDQPTQAHQLDSMERLSLPSAKRPRRRRGS